MPISKTSRTRYDFREPISTDEIESIAADPHTEVIQTSMPAKPETWSLLNQALFARRPDIEARIYGCHGVPCDLGFTSLLTNVRRFAADALHGRVTGAERIACIPDLECLSVGVFQLESFGFLDQVSPGLRRLTLGATRSKKPTLTPLARFRGLQSLRLESQQKDLDVISGLMELEHVTLRSISTASLGCLRNLDGLRSLAIELGGIRDLSAIRGMIRIASLELCQIRGLDDVGAAAELPGLQSLFLQSLPRVRALPELRMAHVLRRVVLVNMKGLRDLGPLEAAPALEEFALVEGLGNEPQDLAPVLRNRTLRRIGAGLGSLRKNEEFDRMREAAGREPFDDATPLSFERERG